MSSTPTEEPPTNRQAGIWPWKKRPKEQPLTTDLPAPVPDRVKQEIATVIARLTNRRRPSKPHDPQP